MIHVNEYIFDLMLMCVLIFFWDLSRACVRAVRIARVARDPDNARFLAANDAITRAVKGLIDIVPLDKVVVVLADQAGVEIRIAPPDKNGFKEAKAFYYKADVAINAGVHK